MKAVVLEKYRSDLKLAEISKPLIQPKQILIRNYAASVNPLDWKLQSGKLKFFMPLTFPAVLGFDFCGQIEAVGSSVTHFKGGEWVFGMSDQKGGAFAEYLVVGEQAAVIKPGNITPLQAALLPLAGLTAWKSLLKLGQLKSGEKVLINGASGGVGLFAIQIAKMIGAHVSAVASAKNHAILKQYGADECIDYKSTQILSAVYHDQYDVILDAVNSMHPTQALKLLKKHGKFITTMPSKNFLLAKLLSGLSCKSVYLVNVAPNQEGLQYLAQALAEDKLVPYQAALYQLSDINKAFELSQSRRVVGKIAIEIV